MITVSAMSHKVEKLFADYGPPAVGVLNFFKTVTGKSGVQGLPLENQLDDFINRVTLKSPDVLPKTFTAYLQRLLRGSNLSRLTTGIAAIIGGSVGPDLLDGHGTLFKGIKDSGWAVIGSTIAGAIFDDPQPDSSQSIFSPKMSQTSRIPAQG